MSSANGLLFFFEYIEYYFYRYLHIQYIHFSLVYPAHDAPDLSVPQILHGLRWRPRHQVPVIHGYSRLPVGPQHRSVVKLVTVYLRVKETGPPVNNSLDLIAHTLPNGPLVVVPVPVNIVVVPRGRQHTAPNSQRTQLQQLHLCDVLVYCSGVVVIVLLLLYCYCNVAKK